MSYNQIDLQTGKTVAKYCDTPEYFDILSILDCTTGGNYGGEFTIFAKIMCDKAKVEYCTQVMTYNAGPNSLTAVSEFIHEPNDWYYEPIGEGLYGYDPVTKTVYYLAKEEDSNVLGVIAASASEMTFTAFSTPSKYINVGSFYEVSSQTFYVAALEENSRIVLTEYDVSTKSVKQSQVTLGVKVDPSEEGYFSIFVYENMLYANLVSRSTDTTKDFPLWIGSIDLVSLAVTPIIQESGVAVNYIPYAMYPFAFEPATGYLSAYVETKNHTYNQPKLLYIVDMSTGQFTKSDVLFKHDAQIVNGGEVMLSPF
ncbi:hypothetical protein SAMD00019534_089630 [Acytostelium subglobosum LB1]|uniref:hypothetical protein n=1 Tax=Acytostelium subglobosum LB1 TaxID=1410327 RepID=UPI000644CE25|nr:hypothetical protein SAMD00019534_089630 [Acytostelium subglobosum LB1]GAM25788.1 hypothetical protein SAMD00019534_089630 [Acytostelium subglobosum LB1]|eukprot:XP_012751306.1 hypothetical protein SAMD00019534_089630 [Acytostelium subglobosum LB1]